MVHLIGMREVNFDKFTLTGNGALKMRSMRSLATEDETFVYLSINDFLSSVDNMSKVNYLTSQGVDNENVTGAFDFSELTSSIKAASERQASQNLSSSGTFCLLKK